MKIQFFLFYFFWGGGGGSGDGCEQRIEGGVRVDVKEELKFL